MMSLPSDLSRRCRWLAVTAGSFALVALFLAPWPVRADTIESVSGNVIEGRVVSRDDKFVVMELKVGTKTVQRKFGLSLIRAITIDGQPREELQAGGTPAPGGAAKVPAPGGTPATRTAKEIDAIIVQAGKEPPDWLADTPLNLPKTLDLSWPQKPQGAWNNQKNVGQFIWDVINPNANRWREGIKLMHHLIEVNKGNDDIRLRATNSMAGMYHHFFQDYARAAYYWRQVGDQADYVGLAECYFRLGNRAMATDILNRLQRVPVSAIKLYADMGDTNKAISLVDLWAKSNGYDEALMHAGDACRLAGRFAQAQQFYEKIVAMPDTKDNKRSKDRARASLDSIRYFDTFDLSKVASGTYKAASLGYEGPVEVTVVVADGKIESVKVTNHREKQYYASINDTPAQIIAKQSIKGVDATSRATITSEAIINATAKALGGGK